MSVGGLKTESSKGWIVPAWRYAKITAAHKFYVALAGVRIGCPFWRLLTHDLSKFGRYELVHYGRQFFGEADQPGNFERCWVHHQNNNDHHWEYWISRVKYDQNGGVDKILPMPENAIREMVADWFGASRAYEGKWPDRESWTWFEENFRKIKLHPKTKKRVEEIVEKALGGSW